MKIVPNNARAKENRQENIKKPKIVYNNRDLKKRQFKFES